MTLTNATFQIGPVIILAVTVLASPMTQANAADADADENTTAQTVCAIGLAEATATAVTTGSYSTSADANIWPLSAYKDGGSTDGESDSFALGPGLGNAQAEATATIAGRNYASDSECDIRDITNEAAALFEELGLYCAWEKVEAIISGEILVNPAGHNWFIGQQSIEGTERSVFGRLPHLTSPATVLESQDPPNVLVPSGLTLNGSASLDACTISLS